MMYTLKVQSDVNAIHHKVTCWRLVESASQEVVNVRRVKRDLREAGATMKAATKSHTQFVQDSSLNSDESSQWMQAIENRHDAAKHRAEDKLGEMGALDQVEGSPNKALVKTQLKKSVRTLRGNIARAVTDINRLVVQQLSRAQY